MFAKKNTWLAFLILITTPVFFAFQAIVETGSQMNTTRTMTFAGQKYLVDKKESVVTWTGTMALAGKGAHTGFVYLSKGELAMENGQLVGGSVEMDMSTITDKVHGSDNNLIHHLKDPDFFDVKKFPTSAFAITKVVPTEGGMVNVTGNLTVKGITNEVTFPAKTELKGGVLNATGNLTIDRTRWDVRYKSGKFFAVLADEAIADEIRFEMKIVAIAIK
ncbi:MAG TPA: YceI family protein [Chryseosolibacter sp.]